MGNEKVLTIYNQEDNEIYLKRRIDAGDIIEYKWTHSFELIPWTEKYKILENNNLLLYEINVAGFGAGIPENKGKVKIENGMVRMTEINQEFEKINWINSNTALNYIKINDDIVIKGSDMPQHVPINLKVKERFSVWKIILSMKKNE
ncbi:MAG: DUF1850 domain-containing protein [Sedimentibacter sp.]